MSTTPSAHRETHRRGGLDPIRLDDLAQPEDNTDLDASTLRHGLLRKLPGGTSDFLRADGAFAAPTAVPGAHASTHENGGSDEIDVTGLSGLLADGQTPLAHATTHEAGGADPIKLDDLAAPDDNTDLDASTSAHGLLKKLPGGTTTFLRADGAFATPSGSGGDLVRLDQIVTSGSQATVDFTSISGSYQALLLIWDAQDTTAGTNGSTITMKVNNDGTSGNYTSSQRAAAIGGFDLSTTNAATGTGGQIGFIPNAGNTGMTGSGSLKIVNYAGTTFHKRIVGEWGDDDGINAGFVSVFTWRWKSTAAITRLTVTAGTAFTNGSVFTLYGLN